MKTEQLIPAYLKSLAGDTLSWLGDGDLAVSAMTSGERHHLFRVVCNIGEKHIPRCLVVRVNAIASEHERGKAKLEAQILSILGGQLAPELYDFDDSGRIITEPVMCMSYVSGKSKRLQDLSNHSIQMLGTKLAEIHNTDVAYLELNRDHQPSTSDLLDYLAGRLERDIERRIPRHTFHFEGEIMERYWRAYSAACLTALLGIRDGVFQGDEPLNLLHGGLGGDNVIWTSEDSPILIDWENARLGDPCEEIAYLFTESSLNRRQRSSFWIGYKSISPRCIDVMRRRVSVWEPVTAIGSAAWWLERCLRRVRVMAGERDDGSVPRPLEYYLQKVEERLDYFEKSVDV